jgi:hypothetical protein
MSVQGVSKKFSAGIARVHRTRSILMADCPAVMMYPGNRTLSVAA